MSDKPGRPNDPTPFGTRDDSASAGAAYMGLGLQFGAAIVLFMFVGMWLDKRIGTTPWLMVIGVFVGAAGGFYGIYRKLMADQKREDAARKR